MPKIKLFSQKRESGAAKALQSLTTLSHLKSAVWWFLGLLLGPLMAAVTGLSQDDFERFSCHRGWGVSSVTSRPKHPAFSSPQLPTADILAQQDGLNIELHCSGSLIRKTREE